MHGRSRRTWIIYAACVAALTGVLGWTTCMLLRLEQAELDARRQAERQGRIRLALWRMESTLAARLAEESARPYFHYAPFHTPHRAYTRLLMPVGPGEVLVPSPLLTYSDSFVRLHFQIEPDGTLTSPQAPTGNLRDEAETRYTTHEEIERRNRMLVQLGAMLGIDENGRAVPSSIERQETFNKLLQQKVLQISNTKGQQAQSAQEYGNRQASMQSMQKEVITRNTALQPAQQAEIWQKIQPQMQDEQQADAVDDVVGVEPFVPQWREFADGPELVLLRKVSVRGQHFTQGIWADWPAVRSMLLSVVPDLLPGADVRPVTDPSTADPGLMLASIPAQLSPGRFAAVAAPLFTPMRGILGLSWAVMAAAVITVGVVLGAAVDLSRRRGEFVSAVTHELRTPLTTFRMYCEMLAEGMVPDEQSRREYLATLQDEADHLSRVVENVLTYARIEQGRSTADRRDRLTAGELIAQATTRAAERARRAGVEMAIEFGGPDASAADVMLLTDPSAVEQILVNLIDNAIKYGAVSKPRVDVAAARAGASLRISVGDNGRGIPQRDAERVFEPFQRGSDSGAAAGGATVHQGVGLGLAISRRLARNLGGDLVLEPESETGATFVLMLPVVNDG